MKMKKLKAGFLALLVLLYTAAAPAACLTALAETKEVQYRPLDVVLTIDTSGSMKTSDEERLVMQAVQMFTNMMPSTDGRVGIVGFNKEATVYTQENGKPAMLDMNDVQSVQDIRTILDAVKYDGDTASGNGLLASTQLLEAEKRDDSNAAIILFSDGVDDLNSELKFNEAQENLTDALQWASVNKVPIYTLGFNYQLKDGKDSLSGEGMSRLQRISEKTGGFTTEAKQRTDIEDSFVKILADICELYYIDLMEVPGDGGRHEIPINVTEGVVEMNIRIACETTDAITDDSIRLQDPSGSSVSLNDGKGTRFNIEKKSANIKVINPASGQWVLTLDGISGDNIRIGLLNHYNLGSNLSLEVPAGNPDGIAYEGDPVTVSFTLLDDEGKPADPSLYNEITSAQAVVRSNETGKESVIELTSDGSSMSGQFTSDGTRNSVEVHVDSPYFHKTNTAFVENGNRPLELTGTLLPDQKVNVKKTVEIPDIYSCVTDNEGDAITAEIADITKDGIADCRVEGDKIVIEGKKWGSGLVTVRYTDAQNNSVETTFALKVRDPFKMALLAAIPIIIGLIAAAVVITGLLAGSRVSGVFEVGPVAMKINGVNSTFGRTVRMRANVICKGRSTTLRNFMKRFGLTAKRDARVTQEQVNAMDQLFVMGSGGSQLAQAMNGVIFKGTVLGRNGFVLIIPKGSPVFLEGQQPGTPVKMNVRGTNRIVLICQTPDGTAMKAAIQYEQYAMK